MKNTVLGVIGCLIVLYTAMLSLGIYSVYVHKNEMEKCLSQALYSVMDKYYLPHGTQGTAGTANNTVAKNDVMEDVKAYLGDSENLNTTIYVCDMEKGIISARVENDLELPMGIEKHLSCTKTIIADRGMDD